MRQPLALALALAIVAGPACAQRGGARGGFSAPRASIAARGFPAASGSAPAFRGNFATATSYRPTNRPFTGNRPGGATIPFRAAGPAYGLHSSYGVYPNAHRPALYRREHDRGRRAYGGGVPYIYPLWLGPSYFDDTADGDGGPVDDAAPADAYADVQPVPYGPISDESAPQTVQPTAQQQDVVTLIFKDGRPPQLVQNYALTRTTLYVIGPHHRDIPVADLDLAATEKANREAGVDFQLPESTR